MRPIPLLRVAVAVGFAGMGVTHFVPSVARGMAAMIPRAITRGDRGTARLLVKITGVCELAGAGGLLHRPTRWWAGGALVAFLAAVFPANAVAAREPERFGRVAVPLLPRAAMQIALAALVVAVSR